MTALQTHFDRFACRQLNDLVIKRPDFAAADVHKQAGHELKVLGYRFEVHAAFEAMAGFGAEFIAPRPAHDGFGPPERPFKVDVGGVERYGSRFAAHDARKAL